MTAPQITPSMAIVIRASWEGRLRDQDEGCAVEIIGTGPWRVARALEDAGLGTIETGAARGLAGSASAYFRANRDAAQRLGLFGPVPVETGGWR